MFAKGSDAKMLSIMAKSTSQELREATDKNLHLFASQVCCCHPPLRSLRALQAAARPFDAGLL